MKTSKTTIHMLFFSSKANTDDEMLLALRDKRKELVALVACVDKAIAGIRKSKRTQKRASTMTTSTTSTTRASRTPRTSKAITRRVGRPRKHTN